MYVGTLIWNMDCLHFGPKSINCGLICKKQCRTYLQPVDKSFDPRQIGMLKVRILVISVRLCLEAPQTVLSDVLSYYKEWHSHC